MNKIFKSVLMVVAIVTTFCNYCTELPQNLFNV